MTERRFEFVLPDLGEGVTEAEIRALHVRVGDRVDEHQTVLEVETDKALVEVPSPRAGIVREIRCAEGEAVAVGRVLLVIEAAGEVSAVTPPAPEKKAAPPAPAAGIVGVLPEAPPVAARPGPATARPPGESPAAGRALPRTRRLARELGVRLEELRGSGPQGLIREQDVRAAAGREESPASDGRLRPLSPLRRRIAGHLEEARQQAVAVTVMDEFDISELAAWKRRLAADMAPADGRLTWLPFFMKATQHALTAFPVLNACFDEATDGLRLFTACHLGIAVDTPEGLLVPVVRDVQQKSLLELASELAELTRLATGRRLPPERLRGSTFTLSNFGSAGGRFATPVLNWPNVGILGCGRIAERPWVVDGAIRIRTVLPLSLTFDHRLLDGAEAGRFLVAVGRYLEDPVRLLAAGR